MSALDHPKNVAWQAISRLDLPSDCRYQITVMSSSVWAGGHIFVQVVSPYGPTWEVDVTEIDDVDSLVIKLNNAVEMVRHAESRKLISVRWADQHPEAFKGLVDPSISLVTSREREQVWALPAGWVPVVNRLHRDLVELLGDYKVAAVNQKLGFLRYSIDRRQRDEEAGVWDVVNKRFREAKAESLTVCTLCGQGAKSNVFHFSTRCEKHPAKGPNAVRGATARPPGWK